MITAGTVRQLLALSIWVVMIAVVAGCNEETTQPEDDSLVLPPLTSPENVVSAIQVIYNDKTHSSEERLAAYASLLDSSFTFIFQGYDVIRGAPASWNREDELLAHERIF